MSRVSSYDEETPSCVLPSPSCSTKQRGRTSEASRSRSIPVRIVLRSRIVLLRSRRYAESADRRTTRRAHGGFVAQAVSFVRHQGPAQGRAPAWPHTFDSRFHHRASDRQNHADDSGQCHALVDTSYGARNGHLGGQRAAHLARPRTQAASRGEFQNQPRSGVRRQAGRYRRPLPESARACAGAVGR